MTVNGNFVKCIVKSENKITGRIQCTMFVFKINFICIETSKIKKNLNL